MPCATFETCDAVLVLEPRGVYTVASLKDTPTRFAVAACTSSHVVECRVCLLPPSCGGMQMPSTSPVAGVVTIFCLLPVACYCDCNRQLVACSCTRKLRRPTPQSHTWSLTAGRCSSRWTCAQHQQTPWSRQTPTPRVRCSRYGPHGISTQRKALPCVLVAC